MSTNSAPMLDGYAVFGIVKALAFAAFFGAICFGYGEIGFAIVAITIGGSVAVAIFLGAYLLSRKESGRYPN